MKDMLEEIIDRYLLEEEGSPKLDQKIIADYLGRLKECGIHVPFKFKDLVIEDIKSEIAIKSRQLPKPPKA